MSTNDNPTSPPSGHRLSAEKKVLPVVGLAIVLVTFIVKDGLREHVKDLKDSIESAQTLNLLRTDSQQIQGSVELINANLLDLGSQFRAINEHEADPYKMHKARVSDMEMQVAFAMRTLHGLQSILETTTELSAEFPATVQESTELNTEGLALEHLSDKLQSMDKTVGHLADVKAGIVDQSSTIPASDALETVVRTSLDVQSGLSTLSGRITDTSASVLKSAKASRQRLIGKRSICNTLTTLGPAGCYMGWVRF
jgi:hypothetical protein